MPPVLKDEVRARVRCERNADEAAIRSPIANFWRYQLAGLTALLRHLDEQATAA